MEIDQALWAKLRENLRPETVMGLARELVCVPSDTPEGEERAATVLEGFFCQAGVKTERQPVKGFGVNVIATLPGVTDAPGLLYNGHLDTVPPSAAMPYPPFEGIIKNDQIWGRGTADMKGGLAAMACALAAVRAAGVHLKRPVQLAAVAAEEHGNHGTWTLIQQGARAEFAIVGEATDLNLVIAHKGVDRYKVIVEGRAAHGSEPEKGVNAIIHAAAILTALDQQLFPKARQSRHPFLGPATYNVGTIQGGISRNTVPDRCVFQIGKRWLPGDSPEAIRAEIVAVVTQAQGEARASVVHEPEFDVVPHPPLELDPDHPHARVLADTIRELTGQVPALQSMSGFTDGALLYGAGIPTLIFGPGGSSLAHSDNEYISVSEMVLAAQVFAAFAVRTCA